MSRLAGFLAPRCTHCDAVTITTRNPDGTLTRSCTGSHRSEPITERLEFPE